MRTEKGTGTIFLTFLVSAITIVPIIFSASSGIKIEGNKIFKPSHTIKSIYLTSWSSSTEGFIRNTIEIANTTEINAVVIDIKDWSGNIFYKTDVEEVKKYGAEKIFIPDISKLIKRFHDENISVIARIIVFQDPILAEARPDLGIRSKKQKGELWLDRQKLAWVDPASKEVWQYNVKIAQDAFNKGFDEVNFDYVRFPSDGDLKDMEFPFWDGEIPKHLVIKEFFKYLRENLPERKISVDLFGLTTISYDDLGVGQIIEDAFEYFDYVCPMVYPSHYASRFQGYEKPAEHPYEVVYYSMSKAKERLDKFNQKKEITSNSQLRPWLQDFNLGAIYDANMVRKQIEAVYNALGNDFSGFMLWSSSNIYTTEALKSD